MKLKHLIQALNLFTSEMYMAALFYIVKNNSLLKNLNLHHKPYNPENLPNMEYFEFCSAIAFLLKVQHLLDIVIAYKHFTNVISNAKTTAIFILQSQIDLRITKKY